METALRHASIGTRCEPVGSAISLRRSSTTDTPLESSRLVEFACESLPGYDVRQKSYGFRKFRQKGSGLRPPTKRCELPLIFTAIGQAVRR